MFKASVCILAGAVATNLMTSLPPWPVATIGLAVTVVSLLAGFLRTPTLVLAGACLMSLAANQALQQRLPASPVAVDIALTVRILEFSQKSGDATSFVALPIDRPDLPTKIRVSWFDTAANPAPGEQWRLRLRLRGPRGAANPGGFDTEGWLFRQRIGATAYVVSGAHNYRIAGVAKNPVDRIRRSVEARIAAVLPDDETAAVLVAVSVGARHRISRDMWDRFAATGTSHLMAISGLHIGMAAAIGYLLLRSLAVVFIRRSAAQDAGVVGGVVVGAVYAMLSGAAIPAERALAMIVGLALFRLARRDVPALQILGSVALLLFVTDPVVILAPGYWLSFAAVFLLLSLGFHLRGPTPRSQLYAVFGNPLNALLRVQVILLAGLFPLSVLFFDRVTLLGPLTNLLVLPIFNLITVPLTLAGALCAGDLSGLGDALLKAAHFGTALALEIVRQAAAFDGLVFEIALQDSLWPIFIPPMLALLPAAWPGRRAAVLGACLVIADRPVPPDSGCVDLHFLDVGQGLAIVARTRSGVLVYDTGPGYRNGGDAGGSVVVPFLRRIGVRHIDMLVVSHGDRDHAGGVGTVLESVSVANLLTSELPEFEAGRARRCVAGQVWRLDDVEFRLLHPKPDAPWEGNNLSCVLEIRAGDYRALLTGDIEKPVETLMAWRRQFNPSYVVTVPHHGSGTSSTAGLTLATRPEFAIVSSGYGNRWGFPKAEVVSRWQSAGSTVLNTAVSGAISMTMCAETAPSPLIRWSEVDRRYWHVSRPPPGPMR